MNLLTCKWYPAANAGEIPEREGRKVKFRDLEVAVFYINGEYRAIDNICPHRGGPLADGIVAGESVFCPLHNWKFDLKSGCALSGGTGQVKTYPVKLIDNKICIAFDEGKFSQP